MSDRGLFTEFIKAEKPLSRYLWSRPEVRSLLNAVRQVGSIDELATFRGTDLQSRISAMKPALPSVGPLQPGQVRDDGGEPRDVGGGNRLSTTRYYVRCLVEGDPDLLRYWPDESDRDLRTVHHDLMARIGGYEKLQHAADDAKEYWRLTLTWQLLTVKSDGPWALYSYLDLTREEERTLASDGDLGQRLQSRYDELLAIVAAIADQTTHFYDVELANVVTSVADERGDVLSDRAEILRSISLPGEWASDALQLDEDSAAAEISTGDGAPAAVALDVIGARYRLSAKSFEDVLTTIRIWADAVEQNPRGFGHLDEDAVSDVLAATLNATVPNAGREVYSRSGKTDIFISADVLAEGTGPAKVYICETKWAGGRAPIVQGLQEQIFRYVTAHSTDATLLVLCRHKNFKAAQRRVHAWASEAEGFESRRNSPIDGWPLLRYRVDGRIVEVCVATVSIPPVLSRKGRRK
ncbi:hypothetical protein [Kribbella endophytica]